MKLSGGTPYLDPRHFVRFFDASKRLCKKDVRTGSVFDHMVV
jgi:hypothetical protein